jgi:outer membrane protein insertion porin family
VPRLLIALVLTAAMARAAAASSARADSRSAQDESSTPSTPHSGGTSSYEGLTVEEITFPNIATAKERQQLLDLIPQHAGQPLERERIRQSIQALYATGRFADIQAEGEHASNGQVRLAFVTSPNYFVGEVRVEGNPNRPTATQVANASKLLLGELFTPEKLNRALENIRQLLEENGYYRASVQDEVFKHPETQQVGFVFRINPGPQAHVGQVRVTGNPGYSAEQIQDIAHLHPSDPASSHHLTDALDRLRKKYQKKKYWLAQATVAEHTYRPAANAVDYTLDIDPGPKVNIVTEGFHISRGVLRKNVPVYQENALDDDLLNEGRRNLLNYLESRGYFDAKVSVKKKAEASGKEMLVVYDIDAGERHKLLKVTLTGNQYFSEDQLRALMQVQPAGRFLSHGLFTEKLLHDDVNSLEDLYRANGFEQVKITREVTDNYRGETNQLTITLHIEEGPQTRVDKLNIVGNKDVSEAQLSPLNIAEGQPFSDSKIAEDRDIILSYYFNHGFPNATFEASAKQAPNQAHRMDVTYTIGEGRRVFVDKVFVSGLHFTRPFVVRRELQMKSGDPLSQIDMLETQKRLYDLGIFSQVDTAVQNPEGVERNKNVLVQIQEAKRYTFNYGLGFEFQTGQPSGGTNQPQGTTGVSPRVSFAVTRLNFRGRNHTLTFSTHVGRLQQRALVSYEAPRWFNSPHWKLSVIGFYDDTVDVTTFTSQRLEGSVQAEEVLSKASNISYRFTYRRVQATNLPANLSLVPLLSQPVRVGGPGFTYIRDHRDNALESTKGSYTTVDGGVASGYFGSERDFSRILFQNSTYYAFGKNRPAHKKFVFARSTRVGIETPFGNTTLQPPGQCPQTGDVRCIPLPELFLSGGGNSHRGFGLNQAGPRDPSTGFPVGGGALFLNNLELRFPPLSLPFVGDNLSFAIFHDAGNVFTTGRDMLDNLLRWKQKDPQLCLQESTADQCNYSYISHAIGIGVRYKTPIGPVRFDFGYNLNPPAFPSFQTLSDNTQVFKPEHASRFNVFFSIGQTF